MLLKKPRYRRFEYEPRFYKPDVDPAERFKKKIESERRSHSRKKRPIILWGVIFVLAFYAYLHLSGMLR